MPTDDKNFYITSIQRHKNRHWVDIIHGSVSAWVILTVSFVITIAAWKISSNYALERAHDRFNFRAIELRIAIRKRLLEYEQMLRGGVGLFNASEAVTRNEWHSYVSSLEIEKYFPGVQGVGYAQWLTPEDKDRFIRQVRAEGFHDFVVRPEGSRPVYTSIVYLEPFSSRNQRAFGYDMYSEPTRHAAMQQALESGKAAMSGRVTLLQETKTDVQYGFLMYLPVYKRSSTTVEERRNNIVGFVYSPFRIRDLMEGILGTDTPELEFEIFDSTTVDDERSMLKMGPIGIDENEEEFNFEFVRQIEIAGHIWTIRFKPSSYFSQFNSTSQPLLVAIGGIVIDFLLFMIILSLARLRKNATIIAETTAKKLGESEQLFKAITDTANDGIVSADDTGRITYINKSAETMFGYALGEIIGRHIEIFIPPEFLERHRNGFQHYVVTKERKTTGKPVALTAIRKDGSTFPIELSIASSQNDDKIQVNAVIRDITEQIKVDRLKNEFISTVSHELRTPLTAIGGSLSIVNSGTFGSLPPKAVAMLETSQRNVDRLANLINELLDMDKIEHDALSMNMQDCDVGGLIVKSVVDNSTLAEKSCIAIELGDIVHERIEVDPSRFHQVMSNLISNAIKFSAAGQSVSISAVRAGDRIKISVVDHGSGIPAEFRPRIFNKFAQADSSDRRAKSGSGLGLNITKSLIERFGGSIDYVSEPGRTTVFFFYLPIVRRRANAFREDDSTLIEASSKKAS